MRASLVLMAILLLTASAWADENVALGKPVTGEGDLQGAPLSTITDGVFLPAGTQWQSGTVWWYGLEPFVVVDLLGLYYVDGLKLQADNNDWYRIEYRVDDDPWTTAWDVPAFGGPGMRTRPNEDNVTWFEIDTITVSEFRIFATSGDNMYSLSEFQARGELVPEPVALCVLGMGAFALLARRRNT